ncbi:hypothetical protein [Metabacillus niabensis]|uniref:hypothetical protein n=1 Tax=Metabacillus niabensis TaxID=324854 RepID=UPI00399FDA7D
MEPKKDFFKNSIKTFCKVENIPSQKTRFLKNDNVITINVKNQSESGLDIECFKIINFILNLVGSTGIKFIQTPFIYPNSQKIDKISISFEEKEYFSLINTIFDKNS